MPESMILSLALSIIGGLLSVLILIIGWMGTRIFNKLEDLAKELHTRINTLDSRLTRVEAVESICSANRSRRASDSNNS